jgi:RNA polymerase sigma-70 factor (ECF subfamily)
MDDYDSQPKRQEFRELMERVRQGSDDAVRELLDRYGPYVVWAVRQKLNKQMRSKADSVDFTQAVWASFFANRDHAERLDRPEALIAFLVQVAKNKVVDEFRRLFHTQKHNLNRERSLTGSAGFEAGRVAARIPTPSQIAVTNELRDKLLAGHPPHYQQILDYRRLGMTQEEIANRMQLSVRTIQRVMQKLSPGEGP